MGRGPFDGGRTRGPAFSHQAGSFRPNSTNGSGSSNKNGGPGRPYLIHNSKNSSRGQSRGPNHQDPNGGIGKRNNWKSNDGRGYYRPREPLQTNGQYQDHQGYPRNGQNQGQQRYYHNGQNPNRSRLKHNGPQEQFSGCRLYNGRRNNNRNAIQYQEAGNHNHQSTSQGPAQHQNPTSWFQNYINDDEVMLDADIDVEMTDAPPLENDEPFQGHPTWQEMTANTANLRTILDNTALGVQEMWGILKGAKDNLKYLEKRINNFSS